MLVATGILILAVVMVLILKSQLLPGNIMTLVPIIAALAIGTSFSDTMGLVNIGISGVLPVTALFIFATIYFGVMSDAGVFEPIIQGLLKRTGKTVFGVVVVTALIALVAHLDGQGITTLLVTVPPMLIVFNKLKIRKTMMALVFATIVPVMNIIPWGGPITRAAASTGLEIMTIYGPLIPIQIIGLILSFVILYIASKAEEKRGEFIAGVDAYSLGKKLSEEEEALRRPKLIWVNMVITIIVLIALFVGVPAHIGFLLGCAIVLPLNYRSIKEQNARVRAHAGSLLVSVYTIIGAGALLGIMGGLEIFQALAESFVSIIPESLNSIIHVVIGIFIAPLSYLLSSEAVIFGVMPIIVEVGAQYSVSTVTIAAMFSVGWSIAAGLCLTNPSVYLAFGLMEVSYTEAFKANFKWSILLATILVTLTAVFVR